MEVKFKKLNEFAVLPSYASNGDAGLDLTCTHVDELPDMFIEYSTGLSIEIPVGYVGLLFPRSSVSKTGQFLCNSTGIIDSSYRGEIKLRFYTMENYTAYKSGDKVGQLIIMPYPEIQPVESKELTETERGDGGWGSTGS